MSDNTKLRPEDLTAEERALWDTLAIRKLATGTLAANAYDRSEGAMIDLLKARRALFGSATEKVEFHIPIAFGEVDESGDIIEKGAFSNLQPATEKAVCPNCGGAGGHMIPATAGHFLGPQYLCQFMPKPAQPEPAAQVTVGYQPIDRGEIKSPPQGGTGTVRPVAPEYRFCRNGCGAQVTFENGVTGPCSDCDKPAAPEMPEEISEALRGLNDGEEYTRSELAKIARDLGSWWRTHAQPVAVGMTEELSMVLLRAEYGATEDERNPNLRDGYVARLKDAIAAVRQQTAQGKPKVELPKVPVFEIRWASQFLRTGTNHRTPLKSGYADAIDAWLAELDAAEGRK